MFLVLDILKSRQKGSTNENHKYVARYRTVGSDKWQYIKADDKELGEDGELKETKAISVIRRFFGVEKPSDIEQRKKLGVKTAGLPYAQTQTPKIVTTWGVDDQGKKIATGRKLVGKKIKPYGSIAKIEISKKYLEQFKKEGKDPVLPDSIKQFLASPEQVAAYEQHQASIPEGIQSSATHPADPTDPNGEKNIHVITPKKELEFITKLRGKINVVEAPTVSLVTTKVGKQGAVMGSSKLSSKPGQSLVIKLTDNDPRLIAKYGSGAGYQQHLRTRPYATKMTAGVPLTIKE